MYKCGHDRRDNVQTAIILADKGYHVQLLPDINSTEVELRKRYLPDVYGNKNPDARINGIWIADFKKPAKNIPIRQATISRLIESAAQQRADIAILNFFNREYSILHLKKGIIGALQPDRNRSIKMVWVITTKKNLFIVYRQEVFDETVYSELETI